ncbi:hypothetical protein [Lysinibacillus sphaericus]|uniref:hypothetical protein n=1 Tax=Lysinibacillus sphaericus TaxID=1421 RepID=UPI001E3D608E|nr:hypothetical protein [Lysinibacillus sphaericus]
MMKLVGSPGVVLKSRFVMPSSDEYKDFINYIDRDDAKVTENIIVDENDSFSVFISIWTIWEMKKTRRFVYMY